jgi:hypothetical protein
MGHCAIPALSAGYELGCILWPNWLNLSSLMLYRFLILSKRTWFDFFQRKIKIKNQNL